MHNKTVLKAASQLRKLIVKYDTVVIYLKKCMAEILFQQEFYCHLNTSLERKTFYHKNIHHFYLQFQEVLKNVGKSLFYLSY